MALLSKSLAGPGYIILNIVRVMNIIGLLAVATASVVMLVKTFAISKVQQVTPSQIISTECDTVFLL